MTSPLLINILEIFFTGPYALPPVFNVDPDNYQSYDQNRLLRQQIIQLLNIKLTNRDIRMINQGGQTLNPGQNPYPQNREWIKENVDEFISCTLKFKLLLLYWKRCRKTTSLFG